MEEREIPVEVIFQPAWGTDIKWLAERVLEDGIDVRVLPQLHRIIWGDARGV
jgi:7-carboxy-7-deazaguanine synthase